jgi:hypothetical protein
MCIRCIYLFICVFHLIDIFIAFNPSFKDLCTSVILFRKCTELNFNNPRGILPFLKHECRPMICTVNLPVNGKLNRIQPRPVIRQSIVTATPQCRRNGGRSRYKLQGPGRPEWGPTMLHIFMYFSGSIIICRLYKLTLTDQPQATLQLTVFDITQIFVSGPPLLGGPKNFFHRDRTRCQQPCRPQQNITKLMTNNYSSLLQLVPHGITHTRPTHSHNLFERMKARQRPRTHCTLHECVSGEKHTCA